MHLECRIGKILLFQEYYMTLCVSVLAQTLQFPFTSVGNTLCASNARNAGDAAQR